MDRARVGHILHRLQWAKESAQDHIPPGSDLCRSVDCEGKSDRLNTHLEVYRRLGDSINDLALLCPSHLETSDAFVNNPWQSLFEQNWDNDQLQRIAPTRDSQKLQKFIRCNRHAVEKILSKLAYLGDTTALDEARQQKKKLLKRLEDALLTVSDGLEERQRDFLTPLHFAIIDRNLIVARDIVADLPQSDVQRDLCRALKGDALFLAIDYQIDEAVDMLIAHGADLGARTQKRRESALFLAAQLGRQDYVQPILDLMRQQNMDVDTVESSRGWSM